MSAVKLCLDEDLEDGLWGVGRRCRRASAGVSSATDDVRCSMFDVEFPISIPVCIPICPANPSPRVTASMRPASVFRVGVGIGVGVGRRCTRSRSLVA